MIIRFVVPYVGGYAGVSECDNGTMLVENADDKPLTLEIMPEIIKSLYEQGFRDFMTIARVGDGFKRVSVVDSWERDEYAPHSPAWESLTREQVKELCEEEPCVT